MAKQAAVDKEATRIECGNGLTLTLKRVEAGFLQKVMRSVPLPRRPTYKTRTALGKTEEFPLDELSARERPEDKKRWEQYQEELGNAQLERSEKVANALYIFGVEPFAIPENGWRSKYDLVGIEVPDNPDLLRAFYIAAEVSVEDQTRIVQELTRLSGVTQEAIEEAEETFRS